MRSINNDAPVKCRKTIDISANSEKVWKIIANVNNWTDWQTDISKAKINGELKIDATFDWKSGGATIHSTLHTVEPYKQIGWTGKTLGVFAIHNWRTNEKGDKTKVTVEESMEGFLARLLKTTFNKTLESGMLKWLELLKKECEK